MNELLLKLGAIFGWCFCNYYGWSYRLLYWPIEGVTIAKTIVREEKLFMFWSGFV